MHTTPRLPRARARRWLIAILVTTLAAPMAAVVAAPASAAGSVTISGQILNADGTPGRDIWVAAWRPGASASTAVDRSDNEGRFAIEGLTAGWKYHLSSSTWVSSPDGRSFGYFTGDPADPETGDIAGARVFVTTSTGLTGLTLRREARTTLSGVFRNADGTPLADAEVDVFALADYSTAPLGFGTITPWYKATTASDGSYVVRGLETRGEELSGHVVSLSYGSTGLTGYPGFVGKDPSNGLVPDDRARAFALTTAPINAGTVTLPMTKLPADRFVLSPPLTAHASGGPEGEILQLGRGTLSAFIFQDGVLQPGVPIRSGLQGQRIYGPGNWGGLDYFWSNEDFQTYVPRNDLVTVDAAGDMRLFEGDGYGYLRPPRIIGNGWSGYRVIPSGDLTDDGKADMLAIDKDGYLKLYRGDGKGGFLYPYPRVGNGWKGFDLYAAGDVTRDGTTDILSVDSRGRLWMYAGRGNGTFQTRIQVGNGWGNYTLAAGADLDGNAPWGTSDIVGRDDATGKLYLYSGIGGGRFATKKLIATGW